MLILQLWVLDFRDLLNQRGVFAYEEAAHCCRRFTNSEKVVKTQQHVLFHLLFLLLLLFVFEWNLQCRNPVAHCHRTLLSTCTH